MNTKGQSSGLLGLLIAIVVVVAIVLPVTASVVNTATQPTVTTTAIVLSNKNGTLLTAANETNLYIDKYVNVNVTLANTTTSANLTAVETTSTNYVRLWVNNVAETAYTLGSAKYTAALNATKATLYKVTAQSNNTKVANVTYYIKLSPTEKTTTTPVNPTIVTIMDLIPLLIAVLALLVVVKFMGII